MKLKFYIRSGKRTHREAAKDEQKVGTTDSRFYIHQMSRNATIKKRKSHFNTWKKWSRDLQLHSSSAKLFNVTLFILHLRQQNASVLLCYKFITPY